MRVVVPETGATGGWLAAGLARARHDVGVLARGASLASLRADGLAFWEGDRWESFRVATTNHGDQSRPRPASLTAPVDVFFTSPSANTLPNSGDNKLTTESVAFWSGKLRESSAVCTGHVR